MTVQKVLNWLALFALLLGVVSGAVAASPPPAMAGAVEAPARNAAPRQDVLYFWDFEGDNGGFGATLDWQWGTYAWVGNGCYNANNVPPPAAYSGTDMWGTVLNTCYSNLGNNANPCANANPNDDSILSMTIDLTGVVGDVELSWWEWYDLFGSFDWAEVRANGDVVWQNCESHVAPTAWEQQTVDLTPYASGLVTIEFHMMASTVVNYAGWYIDDVMVTGLRLSLDAWKDAPPTAEYGDVISYTITLSTTELLAGMFMTDTLPAGVEYAGNLSWTDGDAWYDPGDNAVYWTYSPPQRVQTEDVALAMPEISFEVTVTAHCGDAIVNEGVAGYSDLVTPFAARTEVEGQPALAVSPSLLDATLCPDTSVPHTLSICNEGDCPLVWEVSELPGDVPWLSQSPISGTVPWGECQDVAVTFDATGLAPGDYQADLVVVSNDPVTPTATVSTTLTVLEPLDLVSVTYTITDLQVTFDATATGAEPISFTWDFDDGNTSAEEDPVHVYDEGGCYTVTLAVENPCGMEEWSEPICVCEPLELVSVTYAITDLQVTFDATVAGSEPITYSWAFGDGNTSAEEDPVHVYDEGGCYTVTLAAENPCGEGAWSEPICVCEAVYGAAFSWTPAAPVVGTAVDFLATVGGGTGPFTYTWDFGDGFGDAGMVVSHTYNAAGSYVVELTVENACGTDVVTDTVTVETGKRFVYLPIVVKNQ